MSCEFPGLQGVEPATGAPLLTSDPPMRLRALLDRKHVQLRQLAAADAVVAPSQFLAAMFVKNGFPAERLTVVPYGLEPGRIVPLPAERPRTPLRLAFCGVLSPWKAAHVAVAAVRWSKAPVTLAVHGRLEEPMFADYIRRLRETAGDDPRITFPGPYDAAQAPAVFAGMDALVVPSTWYENTPFVVLEAFAAGVPVLASDLGGLREVVRDGENGLLFRAGDAASLRAAIERLVAEPGLYERLTPQAPSTIARDYDVFSGLYQG